MNKPKVGQTVYRLNIGNAARHQEQKLTPVVVSKVGRKYFYAGTDTQRTDFHNQYHLDNGIENCGEYSSNYCIYETRQEWEDEKEQRKLFDKMRGQFSGYGRPKLTLSQLRKIDEIVEGL